MELYESFYQLSKIDSDLLYFFFILLNMKLIIYIFLIKSVAVMIPAYSKNRAYSIFFILFTVLGKSLLVFMNLNGV